ncbi:MAG: LacI family DNA-binding transcriptional regulator [Anaerolineae bacterium]
MSVTIKDLAEQLDLSVSTVSKALNDYPHVAEETRQRVLALAEELGYRPSITARGLQAQRTHLIAYSWRLLPPEQFSPILNRFIDVMGTAAVAAGYHLLAFPTSSDQAELDAYQDLVRTGRVDGIVLSATSENDPRVAYLSKADFPFVAFGQAGAGWDYPWVDVDGRAGIGMAVDHLVQLGHRRIGFIAWPPAYLTCGKNRYQGYVEALDRAGLSFDPALAIRAEHAEPAGRHALISLLDLPAPQRPTAVVAISDLLAIGAMNEAQDRGLVVGRDLSIVGFDDAPMSKYLRPPLTTIRQPIDEVGELVVQQLLAVVADTPLDENERHILLKPKLIVRDSTGPAPL